MPGMTLTMFAALEEEVQIREDPLFDLFRVLPKELCTALGKALFEDIGGIDLRWLNSTRSDLAYNATACNLVVEYSTRGLEADDETLIRVAHALLTVLEKHLPPQFFLRGERVPTDYDVWIKSYRTSNALYGYGTVGKGYMILPGETINTIIGPRPESATTNPAT